jgi:hypothetical protein
MIASIVMRGLSESYGSWNTSWIRLRTARASAAGSAVMSLPSNQILPAVGGVRFRIKRATVLFPDPLSPTRPSVVPSSISNDTPLTAATKAREWAIGKCLTMFSTLSVGITAQPTSRAK